ncbi:hypothetical protein EZJ49_06380 [Bdellovibrio bacteriovorus]|uniref:hypothetical protein n=1 Tax=Bdellovibrio bacteriovorus TaxID=959 RepID=UPI0021D04582|nr:hypothetical protein [Bdellovibrio bacteriovorus]UXR65874.1 hypothetical protein EZJ49_06380 [Bdellovibrio bacteriovorus]
MQTTLDSSFVERLKQILANRYGKGLQIRQLMDLSDISDAEEMFTRGRDLHIPIRVNGNFLGTAVVPSADDLNSEKRSGVAQLVRMVLEPAMYKWYLDQKEANLEELNKVQPNLENVRLFGESLPSIDDILNDESPDLNESPANELISHLIHFEGRSENNNKKIALQLHELTGRWAFVPFNDIKGQLHSSMDIARLGGMTIFVENVENLNVSEQELLMEYISEDHLNDEPLIVTSSLKNLDELGAVSTLDSKFVDELSVNCFEVDRAPLTAQGLKEVLELFFLKDSPTNA